ncbi:unnamed protein product [Heligmosomoides polygyrus]|uniref:CxC6 domain-containing protein n=1 Tax=Heligmosomoides polygyrus TaxID=6339 RepID=A0A183FW22_HELPZ|nr:unnamed protein product [Heligmosomoides polygyrus]
MYWRTPCPSSPNEDLQQKISCRGRFDHHCLCGPHQEEQFNCHHGVRPKTFASDEVVWERECGRHQRKWTPGRIVCRCNAVYDVLVDGIIQRRHTNQLRHNIQQDVGEITTNLDALLMDMFTTTSSLTTVTTAEQQHNRERFINQQHAFQGCGRDLTWRPRYGKNRLVEHVRTHWPNLVKCCKICDFKASSVKKVSNVLCASQTAQVYNQDWYESFIHLTFFRNRLLQSLEITNGVGKFSRPRVFKAARVSKVNVRIKRIGSKGTRLTLSGQPKGCMENAWRTTG